MSHVINNTEKSRFELEEGGFTAYADYALNGEVVRIKYVFSPEELRGKGTAGRLMDGIVNYARAKNLKLFPICGYAASWLRRHPETADLQA